MSREHLGLIDLSSSCNIQWEEGVAIDPREQECATQVLQEMFRLFRAHGVDSQISHVELYRPNDDGETPCLVILPPRSQKSPGSIETDTLFAKIHAVQILIWGNFHPLPWRFSTKFADATPPESRVKRFFGQSHQLQARVTT